VSSIGGKDSLLEVDQQTPETFSFRRRLENQGREGKDTKDFQRGIWNEDEEKRSGVQQRTTGRRKKSYLLRGSYHLRQGHRGLCGVVHAVLAGRGRSVKPIPIKMTTRTS